MENTKKTAVGFSKRFVLSFAVLLLIALIFKLQLPARNLLLHILYPLPTEEKLVTHFQENKAAMTDLLEQVQELRNANVEGVQNNKHFSLFLFPDMKPLGKKTSTYELVSEGSERIALSKLPGDLSILGESNESALEKLQLLGWSSTQIYKDTELENVAFVYQNFEQKKVYYYIYSTYPVKEESPVCPKVVSFITDEISKSNEDKYRACYMNQSFFIYRPLGDNWYLAYSQDK